MNRNQHADGPHPAAKRAAGASFHWPSVGQRIIKTSIAVTLCLFFYMLRGYEGESLPAEAAITAIICMQPYMTGTAVGAVWGFLFLLMMLVFPALGKHLPVLYLLMGLGTLISLHSALLLRMPDASGLAAIVFVCVVIAYPDIPNPMDQAFHRILDVLVGTSIALGVNACRIPRRKQQGQVFFLRMSDLAADQFSNLSPAVLFRLQYLLQEGAKICLMSEHAPAFQASQLGRLRFNVPMIVMDGAAIYDANENSYLQAETLDPWEAARLREHLDALGLGYFIYTVHNNKICIFHQGKMHEQERKIYERMKRSPYRSYLEGEIYQANEIVYLKIIDETEKIVVLEKKLESFLAGRKLRMVVRPQQSAPGVSGLYIYADTATFPQAEARLMEILRRKDPALKPREVFLRTPYRSEHDAMVLLHRLGNLYEPLKILRLFPRLKERLEKDE